MDKTIALEITDFEYNEYVRIKYEGRIELARVVRTWEFTPDIVTVRFCTGSADGYTHHAYIHDIQKIYHEYSLVRSDEGVTGVRKLHD